MSQALAPVIAEGLQAFEKEDFDAAAAALEKAVSLVGENQPDVLHLRGMLKWAEGDLDHAAGFLMQAADAGPTNPAIYLDCAELLLLTQDDLSEAEAAVRVMLQLPEVANDVSEQGKLLLAQIRFDHSDSDPEEALELLDEISSELRKEPYYQSLRANVLMHLGRMDEAVRELNAAIEADEDVDLLYQLGVTLRASGDDDDRASEVLMRVLELDAEEQSDDSLDYAEIQDLRTRVEDALEELPDPLLRRVANVPITVQVRPEPKQVSEGVDPRTVIAFVGRPAAELVEGEYPAEEDEADLRGLVLMRNALVEEIVDDEDIPDTILVGIVEELRRFFGMDDIHIGFA
jgi:tetratricopeptide (TPR) repeat protein